MEPDQNITDDSKNVKKKGNSRMIKAVLIPVLCGMIYFAGTDPYLHCQKKERENEQLRNNLGKLEHLVDTTQFQLAVIPPVGPYSEQEYKTLIKLKSTVDSVWNLSRNDIAKIYSNEDFISKYSGDFRRVWGSWYTYFKE